MKKSDVFFLALVYALVAPFLHPYNSEADLQGAPTEGRQDLRALLPKEGEIAGWKIAPGSKIFGPGDLWEQINGQAEFYLDYGFQQLLTADYLPPAGNHFIAIEIYGMESPDHAFGIYAAERSPEEHFLKGEIQGYYGKNFLNFWKGFYYVKLASVQKVSDTGQTLLKLSEIISRKIKGPTTEPALFACFPEKNRVKRSERFIPKNFLGQPYMKNGYRVDYARGGHKYQLFLIRNSSPVDAEKVFDKYREFLAFGNVVPLPIQKPDYLEFVVKGKNEYVFQSGLFVGGIVNAADLKEADMIIEEVVQRLKTL